MRFAVIPTRGDRFDVLQQCAEAIRPQVDRIILVDNSDRGRFFNDGYRPHVTVVHCDEQPPNLSRLWNLGIQAASDLAWKTQPASHWEVAVLNDDAIVSPRWFQELAEAMRSAGAAAASFCGDGGPWLHKTPGVTPLSQRLCGWAFILAGELGVRADERLRWWCGDNDLDMQSRRLGGTLVLPGDPVRHLFPNQSTTGVLAEQTAVDMATFVEKWGFRPWVI